MADLRKNSMNAFTGGMNKDISDVALKSNQYRNAENLRVLSDKDNQSGALSNIKGNIESINKSLFRTSNIYKLTYSIPDNQGNPAIGETITVDGTSFIINIPQDKFRSEVALYEYIGGLITTQFPYLSVSYNRYWLLIYSKDYNHLGFTFSSNICTSSLLLPEFSNLNIIGSAYARNDIILFTCPDDESYKSGQIWKVTYNEVATIPAPTLELLYNNVLNFSINTPIRDAKGSIENDECIKVYFTDNNNYLRHFNYADPQAFATVPETLDILGDVVFSKPLMENIISGSLPCGVIQYAYSLYNKYGAETIISPLSNLIHLAINSDFGSSDSNYHGGAGTENSGKGVMIRIPSIDKRYNYIKLYCVLYKDGISDPEVTEIVDAQIVANTMVLTDTGTNIIRALSIDEFSVYNKVAFKCKSFDIKNNLLITGNTSGEDFDVDFDARAFRFNNVAPFVAGLKENDTSPTYNVDATLSNVPEEISNTINVDQTIYKYQKNGHTLGGSGINVEYSIRVQPLKAGSMNSTLSPADFTESKLAEYWGYSGDPFYMGEDFVNNKESFSGYASPFNSGQFRGYARNETYRFGIVLYNKKGLRSPVKWIGDIKMPNVTDTVGYYLYTTLDGNHIEDFRTTYMDSQRDIYVCPIYVDFDVNIPTDIADEVSGFEIVRVLRKEADKTVAAQGLVAPTFYQASTNEYLSPFIPSSTSTPPPAGTDGIPSDVVFFISPEGIFDQSLNYKSEDKLQIIGSFDYDQENASGINRYILTRWWNPVQPVLSIIKNITDNKFASSSLYDKTLLYNQNIKKVINVILKNNFSDPMAAGSTNVLTLGPSGNDVIPWDITYGWTPSIGMPLIANYLRHVEKQYGGDTYEERTMNEYISTGSFQLVDSAKVYSDKKVFGGDIFITFFDYQALIWNLSNEEVGVASAMASYVFPVETVFNLTTRSDKSYRKTNEPRMQERATDFNGTYVKYTQDMDMYQYNPAYSKQSDAIIFFAENAKLFKQTDFDCRLRASDRKVNGSFIDAWTSFLSENYIDINTSLGAITKVINFKNNIYVLQNNALGVASVDDRSIVQDNNANNIILGIGGVLPRYDYINMNSGTHHQYSVIASDSALYYYDSTDRQIKVFTEQEGSISDNYGLKSYLYNNTNGILLTTDNPHVGYGVNGYYDDRYNEVVFTFHELSNQVGGKNINFTLAFNELFKVFTGFYTFSSPIYIKHYSKIISVLRDSGDDLYLHNFGDYNNFYGIVFPSRLKTLLNPSYGYIKVFDSIVMDCEVTLNDINLLEDFFDKVRVYNEYQNSDWHDLLFTSTNPVGKQINYTRRERNYSFMLPRNIVDAQANTNPDIFDSANLTNVNREFRERIRGKAATLDLEFDSLNNKKMTTQFLGVNYRISAR